MKSKKDSDLNLTAMPSHQLSNERFCFPNHNYSNVCLHEVQCSNKHSSQSAFIVSDLLISTFDSFIFASICAGSIQLARFVKDSKIPLGNCPGCSGKGKVTCESCNQSGFTSPQNILKRSYFLVFCYACKGRGTHTCIQCNGTRNINLS